MYLRWNISRRNWNICAMKMYISHSIFKVRIVSWLLKTIWIYNAEPILRRITKCIILISTFSRDKDLLSPWRFMRGFLRGIICDFIMREECTDDVQRRETKMKILEAIEIVSQLLINWNQIKWNQNYRVKRYEKK